MECPFVANRMCGAGFTFLRHALPAVQTSAQRDSFEFRQKMSFRLSLLGREDQPAARVECAMFLESSN